MNKQMWSPELDQAEPRIKITMAVSAVLVIIPGLVLGVVGFLVEQFVALLVIGLIIGAVPVFLARRNGVSVILELVGARDADEVAQARFFNIVDGLSVVVGVQKPQLYVVDSAFPIAMATSSLKGNSCLVVSTGLGELMDRVETEAVVAHLMTRLRNTDIATRTFLLSLTSVLSRIGLGAIGRWISQRYMSQQAILIADIATCQITRYPPALVSALQKLSKNSNFAISDNKKLTSSLWFTPVQENSNDSQLGNERSNIGVTHPSITERLLALKEI